jgi:ribose transport system permease protein
MSVQEKPAEVLEAPQKRRFDRRSFAERYGMIGVLILLVLVMSSAPNFLSVDNAFNIARAVSINAILAAGMTLVILTGGIDLSVGSLIALTGVTSVLLWTNGAPSTVAVVGGILAGALVGFINGSLVAFLKLPAFIVTLGALTYVRGLSYSLTDAQPLIASDLGYKALGNGAVAGIPMPVIAMVIVYLLMWFLLERTTFGRHVYAIGGNAHAARLAGIKVKSTLVRVYIFAGACAGLAGVIFSARVESGQPKAGEGYELDAIAAVVLGGTSLAGGRGRIWGTFVGALIIGVLSNGLVLFNVPFFYQLIVKGLVIVLAVGIDGVRNLRKE